MRDPADDSDQTAPRGHAGSQPPEGDAREHSLGHVLFVDDEEMLVVLGVHILQLLGYRVTGCASPQEALALFAGDPGRYAAVLSDLSMPQLSGFELATRLRAIREDVPIVVMSGHLGREQTAEAARLGIRELLLKPVGIDDLRHALARALDGHGQRE